MELLRLLEAHRKAGGGASALATVVETIGPAYRRAGARQLIRHDRKTWGAVTGGCVESDLIEHALDVIKCGEAKVVRYSPSDDDPVLGLGSGCGGEIVVLLELLSERMIEQFREQLSSPREGYDVVLTTFHAADAQMLGTRVGSYLAASTGTFVQPIVQPLFLFLFGASPAAEPLAHMARQLGWKVRIADYRPAISADERFAEVEEIVIAPVEGLADHFAYGTPSAAVVMTHHYQRDLGLLKQLLPKRLSYVGLVGSRGRAERLVEELHSSGFESDLLSSLHAPAGLDLGVDTPSEIALSIIAEIQATQGGATATPFRDRRGSVHDDASRYAIVILAAGGSRRMGAPKQLEMIQGISMVRRAAEAALAAGGATVHLVAGAEVDGLRRDIDGLPVDVIVNHQWQEGIASSIRAGIEAIERQDRPIEALILMLCDQPGVSADALKRLIRTHRTTRAPVVASRYPDGPGVPALFRAELIPTLKTLTGDIGARQLIRHLDREVVTIPFDAPKDVDTPADLDLLREEVNRNH